MKQEEDKVKKARVAGLVIWLFNICFVMIGASAFSAIGLFVILTGVVHAPLWQSIAFIALSEFMFGYTMLFCIFAVVYYTKHVRKEDL